MPMTVNQIVLDTRYAARISLSEMTRKGVLR